MLLGNLSLLAVGFSFALALGGGFYESIVINPQWSQNPPSSFALIQNTTGVPLQKFWIPVHIVITVLILLALFLNWQMSARRAYVLVALGSYIAMRAWSFMYFIPEMLSFQHLPLDSESTDELIRRVSTWKMMTLWRAPLDIISFISVLWPLTMED